MGLSAGRNIELLLNQIREFRPKIVSVSREEDIPKLLESLSESERPEIVCGEKGLVFVATLPEADIVVSALSGSVGLIPTWEAISAGKRVAIANKEVLVMAGPLVMKRALEKGGTLLPIDSELSAIFQALLGHRKDELRKVILTASGGPFLGKKSSELERVTPEEAVGHPNWRMGRKVSLDSATLMNKGLEVVETSSFFDVPPSAIIVYIHPQSIVHSMVEFWDGSTIAQLSVTDMRIPISYALSFPERLQNDIPPLNLCEIGALTFLKPDMDSFPCLKIAYEAARTGGTYPAVMNAANEVAGRAFLNRALPFNKIPDVIKRVLDEYTGGECRSIQDVLEASRWSCLKAEEIIKNYSDRAIL